MLDKQTIIDALAEYNVTELELLPLGADMNASVYKAWAKNNKCYFVKVKRHYDAHISHTIAQILHDAGIEQIILPIEKPQKIDDFTIIVYPFIEGEDGFRRDLTSHQWFLLGKALRRIHEIKLPILIRRETYSDKWRIAVKEILNEIDSVKSNEIINSIKENREIINKVVLRAEELSVKVKNQTSDLVLCHSDIHGGNVLIDRNNGIYIVDWDDPILAPKERDLMFIGGGVGNLWNKPSETEFFYKGYGEAQINWALLAYYRYERIIEDIALYYIEIQEAESPTERQKIYQYFTDMFHPNGVIDIAFKTRSL